MALSTTTPEKKKQLFVDIETFSSQPLPKCGVYRYSQAADFQILIVTYGYDDEELVTVDLACGESLPPDFLSALEDPNVLKVAHNAQFERVCFSRYLGHWLDPHQWRCSMIMANFLTLPGKLADVAVALNLTERKMEEGKDLIRYFSVPCKATKANGGRTRNLPGDAPDKWEVYKTYNRQDVETERAVVRALERYPLPDLEWELYALDQIINDRGVRIDKQLVRSALIVDSEFTQKAYQRAQEITGLENPSSVVQLKAWLADQDMPMETLAKKVVQEKAKDAEGIVAELLHLRLELSKTSVKKYEAMARTVCKDGRVHGVTQFYGASRTGRWAGRLVQLQNVPQNHLPDLDAAKNVVKGGDEEMVEMLYGSVPNTLSELIRTALIPKDGCHFLVADFSAIEARTLAWLAGEEWVLEEFRGKGKIYEATAARMYHIPADTIVKGNPNYAYRQKGKQATLACIAEGELVLTDHGLKPIETVTLEDRVWDGISWVQHEGLIFKGEGEIITYEGLTATPDHYVWVEGQSLPVQLRDAAASGAHLVQTGNGRNPIRLGKDHQSRKALECGMEQMLCTVRMCSMSCRPMDALEQSSAWDKQRMSKLFTTSQADSYLAGETFMRGKTTVFQHKRSAVFTIWWQGNQIQLPFCDISRDLDTSKCPQCSERFRDGSDRQQRSLRAGKYPLCSAGCQQTEQSGHSPFRMGSSLLAILRECRVSDADSRDEQRTDHRVCQRSCPNEAEELAYYKRPTRLYDLRNAGPHHRFTVSNHLVHNCGFGGGVGAMKNMGATMPDDELQDIVEAWRRANPHIVNFWSAMETAARKVVDEKITVPVGKIVLYWKDGNMFMRLPSGRDLCYQGICYTDNRFGSRSLGYYMPGSSGKMVLTETFGGKLVENCIAQGTLVLIDRGLVPIESITASHLIWDGEAFVSHEGLLNKGIQPVVAVDGIRMTPDHKILTEKGWIRCGSCNGLNWSTVSLPDRSLSCRKRASGDALSAGSQPAARITVRETGRSEFVYDIKNCGPRHRFTVFDPITRQFHIVSNCTQAVARDILANSMLELEKAGYHIVFHVHDEVILEVPYDHGSLEDACAIMGIPPVWASDLPLRADGDELEYYRKM